MAQTSTAKMDEWFDIPNDPMATTVDDISEYYHVQSQTEGGNYRDIIANASLNFPVNTPTRLFIKMPHWVDRSDLSGSRPIQLSNQTAGTTMIRVTGAPTGSQYRIAPESSIRRDIIEISSTATGQQISFDYYGIGSGINDFEMNTFRQYIYKTLESTADYTQSIYDGYDSILCKTSDVGDMSITLSTDIGRITKIYKDATAGKVIINGDYIDGSTFRHLFTIGDYIKVKYDGTYHTEIGKKIKIKTGWVIRNDWTNVHLGTINVTIDGVSSSSYIEGEKVICTTTSSTNSQAEGYLMTSTGSTDTIILRDIISTGTTTLFPDNSELEFELSGRTAIVNGDTKDNDSNLYNGLDNMENINVLFYFSSVADFNDCKQIMNTAGNGGWSLFSVDDYSLKFQVNNNGVDNPLDDGSENTVATGDYYYFLIQEHKK